MEPNLEDLREPGQPAAREPQHMEGVDRIGETGIGLPPYWCWAVQAAATAVRVVAKVNSATRSWKAKVGCVMHATCASGAGPTGHGGQSAGRRPRLRHSGFRRGTIDDE